MRTPGRVICFGGGRWGRLWPATVEVVVEVEEEMKDWERMLMESDAGRARPERAEELRRAARGEGEKKDA